MLPSSYSEESNIRLTVWYFATISWPLAPATPSRTMLWRIPGHLSGLSSLPLVFGYPGTLLPNHSHHLKQCGGRQAPHPPTAAISHPEVKRKEPEGTFPEQQDLSWSLGLNPAPKWHPVEGRLGTGCVEEGTVGRGNGLWETPIRAAGLGQNVLRVLKNHSHPENPRFRSQHPEFQVIVDCS